MEKYVVWYRLWLKTYVKKKMYWVQLLGILAVLLIIASVSVPDSDNVEVGICCKGDEYSRQLTEWLLKEESVFVFREYEETGELYQDVLSGKLECGFIFDKELDRKMKEGDLRKSITYVGNSYSTKGETVQETVYAGLLRIYSDEILIQSETDIYGDTNEERMQKLLEKNHEYQDSNAVFQLEIETVCFPEEEMKSETVTQTYPVQGMVGLFLFFIMFLAYGNKYSDNGQKVEKALNKGERFAYACMNQLAAGTIPAIAGLFSIVCLADGSNPVHELLRMVLLIAVSSVWITFFGSFLKNAASFAGAIVSLFLVNLLVCPVFIDLAAYVPALRYIRVLFPLGMYLMI